MTPVEPIAVTISPKSPGAVAAAPRPITFAKNDDDLGVPIRSDFVLLPLRIETRFLPVDGKPNLWIRIYPDQVAIDSFDPKLTAGEFQDALAYGDMIATCANTDLATQQSAWHFLAARYGVGRAAYLADLVMPAQTLSGWLQAPDGTLGQEAPGAALASGSLTTILQAVKTRASSFVIAPKARFLPTRWIVFGQPVVEGAPLAYEIKRPVHNDLNIGPSAATPVAASTPGGASVDPDLLWLIDFDAAVRVGMAARLPLSEAQARGFRSLYVTGIFDNDSRAEQLTLEQLLTAHRFTDGWAILPQGTPTKNSSDATSGYSSKDPNFANSFALERQLPTAGTISPLALDGRAVASALSLSTPSVAHLAGATGSNQFDAAAMAQAVWSGTIGYYQQFIAQSGGAPSPLMARIHDLFLGEVRGRGPVPAIRVGNVPYGILPVTVIDQLLPAANPNNDPLVPVLSALWTSWKTGSQVYLGKTGDDVADMGAVADLVPSSTTFSTELAIDFNLENAFNLAGVDAQYAGNADYQTQLAVAIQYGNSPAGKGVPPAKWLTENGMSNLAFPMIGAWVDPPQSIVALVVDDQVPSLSNPTESMGYIHHLCEIYRCSGDVTLVKQLIAEGNYPNNLYPNCSLMYLVLRSSVLIAMGVACATLLGVAPPGESEIVDFAGEAGTPTSTLQRLITTLVPGSGLPACQAIFSHKNDVPYADFFNLGDSLHRLAMLPSAELERLFTETIDCCIGRIDAWITALAAVNLRKTPTESQAQIVGGYGWLQDVVPDSTSVSMADVTVLRQVEQAVAAASGGSAVPVSDIRRADGNNGGFLFAPSTTQAAVGAILRNADLTNKDAGEFGIPINLSSARVRNAVSYLDGVRQGASLAALMGERAEEALADAAYAAYIQPLRDEFPLVANKLTPPQGSESASDVAAPNVLDGVALEQAISGGSFDWNQFVAQSGVVESAAQSYRDASGLAATLAFLQDDLSAIADLSTSETIFQIVRGNPERGGSILDAIQSGAQIPEPQIVQTPRTGLAVTHRVVTVAGADPRKSPASPWAAATVRARAEPWLEAWLGNQLPAANQIGFVCEYTGPMASVPMTVADLKIGALDLMALTDTPDGSLGSDLRDLILNAALAKGAPTQPTQATVEMSALGAGATAIPLACILPILQAARELLGRARPLEAEDLAPASGASPAHLFDNAELRRRVEALSMHLNAELSHLSSLLSTFNPASASAAQALALGQAMAALGAFGIPRANPPVVTSGNTGAPYAALATQAKAVVTVASSRKAAAALLPSNANSTPAQLAAIAQAILGSGFIVVPLIIGTAALGFVQSSADWQSKVNGADPNALAALVQQLTHVRPAVAALDLFRSGLAVVNQERIVDFTLAQVSHDPSVPWLALPGPPHDAGSWPPTWAGRVSLMAWNPTPLPPDTPSIFGLVVDEWTERIPSKSEKAAIAFHYEAPLSQAPQAILVATAQAPVQAAGADPITTWNYQTMLQILQDTLALTRARVTDPTTVNAPVPGLSQLLMAQNSNNDTVTTWIYY